MDSVYYKILETKIAHETISGEVVIIHFNSGNYYSLVGGAATVWQWIQGGASQQEIAEAFMELKPREKLELNAFLEQLVLEQVVEKTATCPVEVPAAIPRGAARFEAPVMAKYNDMKVLLLADPIHQVDEAGWPEPLPPA